MNKTILITGSQGFIMGYVCKEMLGRGYKVIGIDDYSKYGRITRDHDKDPNFTFYEFDITKDNGQFRKVIDEHKPNYILAAAAKIGGISFFSHYQSWLLQENMTIDTKTFEEAIHAWKQGYLERIIVMSSSMVYENSTVFPTPEDDKFLPPSSTYGFSKLAIEYLAKGAWEQYKLPFSVVRPFNAASPGELESVQDVEVYSGNIKLLLSHVLPDYINKLLQGQDPMTIIGTGKQYRHITNTRDVARGVRMVIESDKAINEAFNISTSEGITMLDLAKKVWDRFHPNEEFRYILEPGYEYDVQFRSPSVEKAKQVLGFEANISLDETIDELVEHMKQRQYLINDHVK
jgi:nucleoside-diphosphate-sugar epimerase